MNDIYNLINAAKSGDEASCEKIITENSGLIWSIVRRYIGRGVDPDDLYQLGCLGLLKAIRGFDYSLGNKFSTYAVPKIAGEIRRFLRDDGTMKVSRSLKENSQKIHLARELLIQKLGREPLISELSTQTGLTPEEIAMAESATYAVDSLDRETTDDGKTLESILGNDGIEDTVLERISLSQAIDTLPDRDKSVIYLRYFKGLTQDKTAKVLKISQVQVSRIERAAVKKLKNCM